MVENNQQFIFNSNELSLLKNTFAENDALLYTVRKVFLQFDLTDKEVALIKTAITPEVRQVLRKRMLPELTPEYPLGQIPSLLTTLTDQLRVKDIEEMKPQFESKLLQENYLKQCFAQLDAIAMGAKVPASVIDLHELANMDGKPQEQVFVEMTAYLFLLGYIDPMLILVRSIAGEKEETVEKQKERMTRNSNK